MSTKFANRNDVLIPYSVGQSVLDASESRVPYLHLTIFNF